ncbi:hypothetical protein [Streptomyces verrucosisporus]|uniref:hypothetical protein n=1 Tax=Streptomyces verrucosisporus TaxID=1695161 RepID=UPI001F1287D7|nr:hypothetical protein [Streptomyces verrucosisporus]
MRQTIEVFRTAINRKRWPQARYALSRAQALVNALPANLTAQEREQLSQLRKKYAARDTPTARSGKKPQQKSTARTGGKNSAAKTAAKKVAAKAARVPKPAPVRDLGNRFIDRAKLGYVSTDRKLGSGKDRSA